MSQSHPFTEAGFTLMEALVAVVILATFAVALQTGVASDLRAVKTADTEVLAVALARLKLMTHSANGETSGQDGNLTWRLTITPFGDPVRTANGELQALWEEVEVRWRDTRTQRPGSLSLKRLKLRNRP